MALDPSIILRSQPAQIESPLVALSQLTQLQELRDRADARRVAAEEARTRVQRQRHVEDVYSRAITVGPDGKPKIDYGLLLSESGLPGDLRPAVLKEMQEDAARALDFSNKTLTNEEKKTNYLASAARTVKAAGGNPLIWGVELLTAKRLGALDEQQHNAYARIQDPQQILALAESYLARAGGAEAPGLEKITTVDEQGREVTQFVVPTAGASYPVPPKATAADSFTLSPGAVRFSATGERIAEVPPTPPAPRDERLVQVLGPNGQPIWVRESQAVGKPAGAAPGEAGGAVKLSAGQQEDIATMLTVQDLGKDVLELGERIKWRGIGPIAGRAGAFEARWLGTGGEEPERLRNLLGNIQGTIAKLRGGASFTPNEQAMLDRYTPTPTDSVLQIKTKLKSLSDFITTKRENTIRVAGGQYTPRETSTTTGPRVGERRTVNGQLAEWDGKGWKAVR